MVRFSSPASPSQRSRFFWLAISLLVTIYYGVVSLIYAVSVPDRIQDDVRQYGVWMQQWQDSELFPQDWIASYFRAVSPLGFQGVFAGLSRLGLEPLVAAKLLPLMLALITTAYGFHVFRLLLPSTPGACLSTVLLNQQLWLNDDLISATPRAFVYPIFLAFLYYRLRRSLLPCLVTIGLQGLFFPQLVLVQVGVLTLGLGRWQDGQLRLSNHRSDYWFWGLGIGVALAVLLPFALSLSTFGAPVSVEQMRSMPEYGPQGRNEYFGVSPIAFWLKGRSGLRLPLFPSVGLLGLGLPWVLKWRDRWALPLSGKVRILADVLLASLLWYGLAHLLLLRLYFPSRYTYHSFRIILPLSAAIVLTLLWDKAWSTIQTKRRTSVPFSGQEKIALGLAGLIAAIVTIVPLVPPLILAFQNWQTANVPALHTFLAQQPKSDLLASLAAEADNVPAFARRSTLVGREFAIAHHPRYYQQIQQRAIDLIQLQYSPDSSIVQQVIRRYGIDWIWIEANAFQPDYLRDHDWLLHSSFQSITQAAIHFLEQGQTPAIVPLLSDCTVLSIAGDRLLDADCVVESIDDRREE